MGIKVQLDGFEKLDQNLLQLGGPAGERILRAGARAAGEVVQAALIEGAPERDDLRKIYSFKGNPAWNLPPGAIKSDITLRVTKNPATGGVTALVGPGLYSRPVCYWLEYGHRIVRGGYSRISRTGARGPGSEIGTVPPHPFIRAAKDGSEGAAVEAAEGAIADGVIKELRKMGVV